MATAGVFAGAVADGGGVKYEDLSIAERWPDYMKVGVKPLCLWHSAEPDDIDHFDMVVEMFRLENLEPDFGCRINGAVYLGAIVDPDERAEYYARSR